MVSVADRFALIALMSLAFTRPVPLKSPIRNPIEVLPPAAVPFNPLIVTVSRWPSGMLVSNTATPVPAIFAATLPISAPTASRAVTAPNCVIG